MTQCFITRLNTSKFVKNIPLRVVFSTLLSVFHLVMKHCVFCLIYYILFSVIHHFHKDHNSPCLHPPPPLPNFPQTFFLIFPGCYSRPKRKRRQWLCKMFFQCVELIQIDFHLYYSNSLIIHKENTKEINVKWVFGNKMKNFWILHPWFLLLKSFRLRSNIKQLTHNVSSPDETPRSSSKIPRRASYFQLSSQCFIWWWNTASHAWYIIIHLVYTHLHPSKFSANILSNFSWVLQSS